MSNPLTRHPAVLAGAFATLDELSGGRATLGMGVGESAVRTIGRRPAKLATMQSLTEAVHALARGEHVQWEGAELHLPWAAAQLPIVYASSGPRSLALSGRTADGVLFQVGALPAMVDYALRHVQAGEREADRPPGSVRRLCRLACAVSEDPVWAREQVQGYVAAAAGTTFAAAPPETLPPELVEDLTRMKAAYDYRQHASQEADHRALVTDRIIDAISIAGTPQDAVPRLRALAERGVDGFVLPMTSNDPVGVMRLLAGEVIPQLAR